MRVFITKYALTSGIREVETDDEGPGVTYRNGVSSFYQYAYGEGKEWARTEEEALSIADTMIAKRITSLQKQTEKLRKLKVKVKRL